MPVITTAIATAINFRLKFVMIFNASSAPTQRLGEEKSCAALSLSNMDAKQARPAKVLSFAQSQRIPLGNADGLTPFGNTSHGIVHVSRMARAEQANLPKLGIFALEPFSAVICG